MRTLLTITILLFFASSFGQKKSIEPIKQIPSVSLYNLNGDTSNLLTLSKGKVTFIDFWFIPCGPCFAEMNLLHKLYSKYKDNPNICFITITLTDSSFVRPLIENKNIQSNETYSYFKSLSQLDTFRLPVYFIDKVISKQKSFVKSKIGFSGRGDWSSKDNPLYPNNLFDFSGYPTILIFDKKGHIVYNKTGFTKDGELQQKKSIQAIIEKNM